MGQWTGRVAMQAFFQSGPRQPGCRPGSHGCRGGCRPGSRGCRPGCRGGCRGDCRFGKSGCPVAVAPAASCRPWLSGWLSRLPCAVAAGWECGPEGASTANELRFGPALISPRCAAIPPDSHFPAQLPHTAHATHAVLLRTCTLACFGHGERVLGTCPHDPWTASHTKGSTSSASIAGGYTHLRQVLRLLEKGC